VAVARRSLAHRLQALNLMEPVAVPRTVRRHLLSHVMIYFDAPTRAALSSGSLSSSSRLLALHPAIGIVDRIAPGLEAGRSHVYREDCVSAATANRRAEGARAIDGRPPILPIQWPTAGSSRYSRANITSPGRPTSADHRARLLRLRLHSRPVDRASANESLNVAAEHSASGARCGAARLRHFAMEKLINELIKRAHRATG